MSLEYVVEMGEGGGVLQCECCQWEGPTRLFDKPIHRQGEAVKKTRLCQVCSSTFIGNAWQYQKYDNLEVLQCLAQCTHMVLDAIEKRKTGE